MVRCAVVHEESTLGVRGGGKPISPEEILRYLSCPLVREEGD